MTVQSLGTTGNKQWDEFSLPRIWLKIQKLTLSFNNDYVFCHLIGALKFESDPASCDKKSHSEHQIFFTDVGRSGHKTSFHCVLLCFKFSAEVPSTSTFPPSDNSGSTPKKETKGMVSKSGEMQGLQGNCRISWGLVLCYTATISPSKVF